MRRRARLVAVVLAIVAMASCKSGSDGGGARLERISLGPREARRSVGQAQHFAATGHYAGGATRNLTQRLDYTSSDTSIARASNPKGDRSRVEAVAVGTVTISATDPTSGISSRASGGDATFTVLGALERLTLAPTSIKRAIGQAQRLTATGHYAGGTTRNLTQHVEYRSSDPAIVRVFNAIGDKSRIDAVAVGFATISAVDPASGIASSAGGGDATVTVTASTPERESGP